MGAAITITPDSSPVMITPDIPRQESTPSSSLIGDFGHAASEYVNDQVNAAKGIFSMLAKPPETKGDIAASALGPPALMAKRTIEGYYNAVRHHIDSAEQAAKNGDKTGVLMHSVSAGLPLVGPLIGDVYDQANSGDIAGAIGKGASRIAQAATMAPEGSTIPNPLDILTKTKGEALASRPHPNSLNLTLPQESLDVAPAASKFQPALANTPREVLEYAKAKGINLTPSEATKTPVANTVQAIGERSLLGGSTLAEARDLERQKLQQNVSDFADRQDPHKMGTSDAEAGDHIKRDAQVAMEVAKSNANAAYDEVGVQQENLAGNVNGLAKWTNSIQNVRQPGAAVARPEYQSPAVKSALDDIASKPEALGPNPSVQSMRNLRTELWEKGNDYTGTIPDSAKALYKQAAAKVDDYIMDAAKGTNFEEAFRNASNQWKGLQQKYNTPASPIYRILQQNDPARITNDLLNRASATDIITLKNENMQGALQALRRRVIEDVANKGFKINGDGLAGYSDEFLNQLFGRPATKELYLNSDLARRMRFQENPSGTSNVMLGHEQMTSMNPGTWIIPKGAAMRSMPRSAETFLNPPVPNALQKAGWVWDANTRSLRRIAPAALPGAQQQ